MRTWDLTFQPGSAILTLGPHSRVALCSDRVVLVDKAGERVYEVADVIALWCDLVRLPLVARLGIVAAKVAFNDNAPGDNWSNSATVSHRIPAQSWQDGKRTFDDRSGTWVDTDTDSVSGGISLRSRGFRDVDSTIFWVSKWTASATTVIDAHKHAAFMDAFGRKPSQSQLEAAWQGVL